MPSDLKERLRATFFQYLLGHQPRQKFDDMAPSTLRMSELGAAFDIAVSPALTRIEELEAALQPFSREGNGEVNVRR